MAEVSECKWQQISTICNERLTTTDANTLTAPLDLPNEIVQKVLVYISYDDLLSLAIVMEKHFKNKIYKRWRDCCHMVLERTPTELPSLLCKMTEIGDLEKVKQIFKCVDQQSICGNKMGVKKSKFNAWNEPFQRQNPRLVDTSSGANGKTPLILAAENGHIDVCDYLITHQMANLKARDNNCNSALIHASWNNQIEVTKLIVNHSGNIRLQGASHAAYLAAQNGHLEVLKVLVEKDEAVVELTWELGQTPLIVASKHGRLDVCKYLITRKKTDVNKRDRFGYNALQIAVQRNYSDIVNILSNTEVKEL